MWLSPKLFSLHAIIGALVKSAVCLLCEYDRDCDDHNKSLVLGQKQDVQMHSFENGTCSHYKKDNWAQLQRILQKQEVELPEEFVLGTMEGRHGAGVDLLETLYETLNQKKWVPQCSSDSILVQSVLIVQKKLRKKCRSLSDISVGWEMEERNFDPLHRLPQPEELPDAGNQGILNQTLDFGTEGELGAAEQPDPFME